MGKPFETDLRAAGSVLAEGATAVLGFTVQDEDGDALPGSSLDACTYTLVVKDTGRIINEREAVDVLADITEAGVGAITLGPADNAILGGGAQEDHELLVTWTWTDDAVEKVGKARIYLRVENLTRTP